MRVPQARLDVEWYRKQAKQLLAGYRTAAPDAVERVQEVLGPRARERFLLSHAQYVLAAEHGFRKWAEFARFVDAARPARHVARIGSVGGTGGYDERARELQVVEMLVERGADLTLRDKIHDQTALRWAERLDSPARASSRGARRPSSGTRSTGGPPAARDMPDGRAFRRSTGTAAFALASRCERAPRRA